MPTRVNDRHGVKGGWGVLGCEEGEISKSPPPPLAKEKGFSEGDSLEGVATGIVGGVTAVVNADSPSDNNKYAASKEGETRQFPCNSLIDCLPEVAFPEGDANFLGVAPFKLIRTEHAAVAATISFVLLERSRTESPLITPILCASCSVKKTRWSF